MRLEGLGRYLLAAFIALPLTFLGLRFYFNEQRLAQTLILHYPGAAFEVLAGQTSTDGSELIVTGIVPQGKSLVRQSGLSINSRFYNQLVLNFTHKAVHQPLTLRVYHNRASSPVQQPILYTHQKKRRFELASLIPDGAIISAIELETALLLAPYQLHSLTVEPKYFSNRRFALLLWDCLSVSSSQMPLIGQSSDQPNRLIRPKILIFYYLISFSLVYLLLAKLSRWPVRALWWVIIVVGWLLLDSRYLFEKTLKARLNYQGNDQLSTPEKVEPLALSPKALAQTVLSVLPYTGSRKKIYIHWKTISRQTTASLTNKNHLENKLKYYLYPHKTVLSTQERLNKKWLKEGFYWVEWSQDESLNYDEKQIADLFSDEGKFSIRRLLKKSGITIYTVLPTLERPKK